MRLNDNRRSRLLVVAVLPALATLLVMVPYLTGHWKEVNALLLWSLLVMPVAVAFEVNALRPAATTFRRALLAALPQLLLFPGLLALGVWADVQRGYYVGGELDMAIGVTLTIAPVLGITLMLVTAVFGRLGAFVGRRTLPMVIVIAILIALPGYGMYLQANPAPWRCYENPADGTGGCGYFRGSVPEGMVEVPADHFESRGEPSPQLP